MTAISAVPINCQLNELVLNCELPSLHVFLFVTKFCVMFIACLAAHIITLLNKEGIKKKNKDKDILVLLIILHISRLVDSNTWYLLSVCSLIKSLTACEVRAASRFYKQADSNVT